MYSCIVAIWEVQYIVINNTMFSTAVLIILCCRSAHYMKYTMSCALFLILFTHEGCLLNTSDAIIMMLGPLKLCVSPSYAYQLQ